MLGIEVGDTGPLHASQSTQRQEASEKRLAGPMEQFSPWMKPSPVVTWMVVGSSRAVFWDRAVCVGWVWAYFFPLTRTELGPGLEGEAGSGIWLVQALCGTELLRSLGT